jgi:hypothetical protein
VKESIMSNKKLMVEKLMQKKEARTHFDWILKDLSIINKIAG